MDTVNTTFFNAMCSFFLTEAWRITGKGFRQFRFRCNGIDKLADHGMFAGSDEVKIFSFDLVHHGFHFRKAHNSRYHVAADHERRNAICKSSIDHKISCISKYCRMDPSNVAHKIIKTIACHSAGRIHVNAVKAFHNLCMIGDLKIRHHRITEFLDLHIFTVILTNRNRRIDNIGDHHHDLLDLLFHFVFFCSKGIHAVCLSRNLLFDLFCFFFLSLSHHGTDLLGQFVSVGTKSLYFVFDLTVLLIQLHHFIYKSQFFILKLIFDILFYNIRILS